VIVGVGELVVCGGGEVASQAVHEEHPSTGLDCPPYLCQKVSKCSSGTCESQKPKKHTS
jgi:hypothetical protein